MPLKQIDATEDYLLVLTPGGRDSQVTCQMLGSGGVSAVSAGEGQLLFDALRNGTAAAAIVTVEALSRLDAQALREALDAQPPWSDFPIILLTRRGEPMRQGTQAIEELGNVTILERPLHPTTLVSAARSAIRSRRRQRLARAYLQQREEAEREVRNLAESLERKVVERTRELAQANDRLTAEIGERERAEARLVQSQKMEAIGQLTGGIAHDFNNLLTAVVGSIDLLTRRTDDEKLLRLARNALQGAERGAQLTAQLLAFSRRQRLAPKTVDVNNVVGRLGDLLPRTLGTHVRVKTNLDERLWPALVDPTQLEMALLNLAINARDAMPAGGELVVSTSNVPSRSSKLAAELAPGAYVLLSVRDDGSGMSPSTLDRAIEPFFTTKAQGKGTGLGLSQVYGFAQQSGGALVIDSSEGLGTEVSIYLPRAAELARAEVLNADRHSHGAGARILLVDDDEDVREVAAAMLQELGYVVEAEGCGRQALARLKDISFDLLLTDVVMPEMNGVDLARQAASIRPDMPILFATGYAEVEAFGEGLRERDVVKKPYRMTEIASRVEAALSGAETHPATGN